MTYHCNVFDKSKPMPAWLTNPDSNVKRLHYWVRLWYAQPVWADTDKIRAVYKEAARLRRFGFDVVVDHVIPLYGADICGLHVHDNLQIIDRVLNAQISNHVYPGAPFEQFDMFGVPAFLRRPPKQRKLRL